MQLSVPAWHHVLAWSDRRSRHASFFTAGLTVLPLHASATCLHPATPQLPYRCNRAPLTSGSCRAAMVGRCGWCPWL